MTAARVVRLGLSFPSLRGRPGIQPWAPELLAHWAAGPSPSLGAHHAARFLLALWGYPQTSPFDVHDAMTVWDAEHRRAFLDWAIAPWWC